MDSPFGVLFCGDAGIVVSKQSIVTASKTSAMKKLQGVISVITSRLAKMMRKCPRGALKLNIPGGHECYRYFDLSNNYSSAKWPYTQNPFTGHAIFFRVQKIHKNQMLYHPSLQISHPMGPPKHLLIAVSTCQKMPKWKLNTTTRDKFGGKKVTTSAENEIRRRAFRHV